MQLIYNELRNLDLVLRLAPDGTLVGSPEGSPERHSNIGVERIWRRDPKRIAPKRVHDDVDPT